MAKKSTTRGAGKVKQGLATSTAGRRPSKAAAKGVAGRARQKAGGGPRPAKGTARTSAARPKATPKATPKTTPKAAPAATVGVGGKRATQAGTAGQAANRGAKSGKKSTTARAASGTGGGKGRSAAGGRATGTGNGAEAVAAKRATKSAGGRAKVGSDRAAATRVGGRTDFGTPARKAKPRGRSPDSAEGLPRNQQGRSGDAGDRTHGVGTAPAGPGSGSGGDVDTDFIGVGIDPVAQNPPTGVTKGPASTSGGSEEFASGPPARGENRLPPGTHGAAPDRTYDTAGPVAGGPDEGGGEDDADVADPENE